MLRFHVGQTVQLVDMNMTGTVIAFNVVEPGAADRVLKAAGYGCEEFLSVDAFYPAHRYPYKVLREDGKTFPYSEHSLKEILRLESVIR